MIRLVNEKGVLCLKKDDATEVICDLSELMAISIGPKEIVVESKYADITFEHLQIGGCGGKCCKGRKETEKCP